MRAILISIGDELVLGQTVDTNAAWVGARLAECGVMTMAHQVMPDDRNAIAGAITEASEKADLVIMSGGLGPTPDDMTRHALADATGAPLIIHPPTLERIRQRFRERELVMPDCCRAQALVPEGAEILDNPCGTAPGLKIRLKGAEIIAVPGVPLEMKAIFAASIRPALDLESRGAPAEKQFIRTLTLNTFGCGESGITEKLGTLLDRSRNPKTGTTVSDGIVSVRICSVCNDKNIAERELAETAAVIRQKLGPDVFGEGSDTLQDAVGRLLLASRKTVVTAESCTAGLLGKLLTDPPGASQWYLGGWILYEDRFKHEQLGVPMTLLKRHGAVSERVAGCMAEQALKLSRADYSLALTGIAGPDGAKPDKPVGTVWIALGKRAGTGIELSANRFLFPGTRECVRDRSAKTALNLLRRELMNLQGKAYHERCTQ